MEERPDEDAQPPLPNYPVSRSGDLWLCGSHRVLCGDATDGSPDQVANASVYLNNWHLIFAYVVLMSLPMIAVFGVAGSVPCVLRDARRAGSSG